ncbi:hypothetical protein ACW95P_01685 [Candidatus Mycoplasma pogonae]
MEKKYNEKKLFFDKLNLFLNDEFFEKFNLVFLATDNREFYPYDGLDSINIFENKIFLNYINGEKILNKETFDQMTIYRENEIYFAIIPKLSFDNYEVKVNNIESLEKYNDYRKKISYGVFYKFDNEELK